MPIELTLLFRSIISVCRSCQLGRYISSILSNLQFCLPFCRFLYNLSFWFQVRGFKVVVRHLPHEVKYMEAVLQLLEKQNTSKNWETRYVLVLWLSILVLIPFHLSRFDSDAKGDHASTLMQRILKAIQVNLSFGDKSQDAVAFLSAKFLTRPEIVQKFWPEFLDWALQGKKQR